MIETQKLSSHSKEADMKRLLGGSLVAVLVLCVGYAAHAIHETMPSGTMVTDPGADAPKLYNHIMKPKPYTAWSLMPGEKEMESSSDPHGSFMTCYVNKIALTSIKKKTGMADRSVIVAENYNSEKKLESLTVMYKIKDYNPEAGDWFWAKYDPANGYVLASGKVNECVACHSSKKDNDYLHLVTVK
jgi:hypothetical protein